MNIGFLLLNNHGGKGGMESVLEKVTCELKKAGISSFVYLLYKPSHEDFLQKFDNIFYLSAPSYLESKQSKLPRFIKKLLHKNHIKRNYDVILNKMNQDRIDLLIVLNLTRQFSNHFKLIHKFKEKSGVPILSWTHSSISDTSPSVIKKIEGKINIFDGHLAISPKIQNEIIEMYQQKNVHLIYNPVDLAPIIPRDPTKFVFIGRIDKNKRVHELIKIFSTIIGTWSFDIYGSTGSSEQDDILNESIIKYGLQDKILFHGWTDDPWSKITSAGTLLLNSVNEGLPLCIVEAMMRGIPSLSSHYPGADNLIIQNYNGWLYDTNDLDSCRNLIQNIVDKKLQLPAQEQIQELATIYSTPIIMTTLNDIIDLFKK